MKRSTSEQVFAYSILSPAALIVFGVVLIPLGATLLYSLQNIDLTAISSGGFVGLKNYAELLTSPEFWESFGRTVYFAAVSIALELFLGMMIALLLNDGIRGQGFLRAIIILPWAIPTIVNGSMWKWIYHSQYGVLNALLTQTHLIEGYRSWLNTPDLAMNMVILADVWKMTPLVTIFFLASLQMINTAVYEAAVIDGAGRLKRFWYLTLPYLKPTILVLVVIRTMEAFKAFDIFYAITRGGPANGTMVLTYDAYLKAFNNLQFSKGATIAYTIAIIVALLVVIYVKTLKTEEGSHV